MTPALRGRPLIDLTSAGTPAHAWLAGVDAARIPPPDWRGPRRVVLLAPHPDDETLGVGGTVAAWRLAGVTVTVVLASDGEAVDPDAGARARRRIGQARRVEAGRALARLGVPSGSIVPLGLPDGGLDGHEDRLASLVAPHLCGADWLVSTWRHDGHPDHEACGRAAARAAAAGPGCGLAEYLVWAWHWAEPGSPALPRHRLRAVRLDAASRAAKRAAAAEHRSQVLPGADGAPAPLPATVVARWLSGVELIIQ